MKIIIGLGNPGTEYHKTRHNIGEHIVREFAKLQGEKLSYDKFSLSNTAKFLGDVLAVPEVYMNESGKAVVKFCKNTQEEYKNILIIRDDLDLPLGNIRLVFDSGSGGHNGMESIKAYLKTQKYWQLKIGICPEVKPVKEDVSDFVIGKFKKEEWELMQEVTQKAFVMIADFLKK